MTILPDPPDFVTPGAPVEALWGNEVVAWVREAVAIVGTMLPIGVVVAYGGAAAPTNWLMCQGGTASTTTYSALYAVVGDRFNQGQPAPGAGNFRLPNMQARYPVGANVGSSIGQGSYWGGGGVGEIAGSYDAVMPSHNHTVPDHLHAFDLWSGDPDVQHVHQAPFDFSFFATGFDAQIALNRGSPSIGYYLSHTTWPESTPHKHRTTGTTGASDRSLTSGLSGGGSQIPPGVAFNFIIRAR